VQTTLWQQDGWAKGVAHTACVHYDFRTGQHKVANKGARGRRGVVIWLTRASDATSMCVRADQDHSCLMGEPFFFLIHTASAPSTAETHTDGGAVIRKPGSAWLEGTPAINIFMFDFIFVVLKWTFADADIQTNDE